MCSRFLPTPTHDQIDLSTQLFSTPSTTPHHLTNPSANHSKPPSSSDERNLLSSPPLNSTMGLFSLTQKPSGPLLPFNPPLGVNTAYCVPNVVTLVLKEKALSWSGDDFGIKDSNGNVVVVCHGSALSFRDKKEIRDTNGRVLFKLETKLLSLLKSFFATGPDGKELFQVKKKWSIGTNKMVIYFTNAADGAPIELDLKGNFWGGSAEILLGERTVATISRDVMNMRQIFVDKQTYAVVVAPGVDLAMIAACCLCLDEAENEQH